MRALGVPWGATSKGIGGLMRHEEREHRQPHEVRRASTQVATLELVLEVLAVTWKVRSPPSRRMEARYSKSIGILPMMEERWAQARRWQPASDGHG